MELTPAAPCRRDGALAWPGRGSLPCKPAPFRRSRRMVCGPSAHPCSISIPHRHPVLCPSETGEWIVDFNAYDLTTVIAFIKYYLTEQPLIPEEIYEGLSAAIGMRQPPRLPLREVVKLIIDFYFFIYCVNHRNPVPELQAERDSLTAVASAPHQPPHLETHARVLVIDLQERGAQAHHRSRYTYYSLAMMT